MAITAIPTNFCHPGIMQRVIEEAEYVLTVLIRMRDAASTNTELYDPDARKRIDDEIARMEGVLRYARLAVSRAEQNLRAA